jgi:hypothetical protein
LYLLHSFYEGYEGESLIEERVLSWHKRIS